jgi:putative hydrolase of the HAD superfamily
MVGNSLRSDILPILDLGGVAVYIPYATTWAHEAAEPPPAGQPGYFQLDHLGMLPTLLEQLEHAGKAREHGLTGRSAGQE